MDVTVEHRPRAPPGTAHGSSLVAGCQTAAMTSAPIPAPVVLVGFMGAGKTTVGRIVADRLGVAFADSDDVITARTGRTPREIFAADGEATFRDLEREVIRDLVGGGEAGAAPRAASGAALGAGSRRPVGVLALGGGAVEDAGTREVLRAVRVVHLEVSFEQVRARVGSDPGRPVLARPDLSDVFAARQAAYGLVANVVVPTDGLAPPAVADRVLAALSGLEASL
jgi:shikimate kinase